eukprot:751898-Prorocentrum_lima.AAC.1
MNIRVTNAFVSSSGRLGKQRPSSRNKKAVAVYLWSAEDPYKRRSHERRLQAVVRSQFHQVGVNSA